MQQVNFTMWKLNSYWKATEASKQLKLLIFDAVLKSKLVYGMETVQLTEAMINKLDAFQMKGLRCCIGKKHTYWDRTATNESILETATRIVRTSRKHKKAKKEDKIKQAKNFRAFAGSEKVREDIRLETEQQDINAEQIIEDHWETEANRLDQDDEAKLEAMSREVLKNIWIKGGNHWGVEDIMEEREGSQKQI